jgi:hypothetical protein
MTVKELQDLLAKVVTEDPTRAEFEIGIEGCDCTSSLDGISIDSTRLWMRREDGCLKLDNEPIRTT